MKRIITLLLAVVMLAGVVAFAVACGGGGQNETTTTPKTTTQGTTTNNGGASTTTNNGGASTTTNNGGAGTTTEPVVVDWDGKTKYPGKLDVDFGGRTFIIASRNDGQGYDTTPEVWVETITNDSYNDSVFERNKLMNELYNCTIEVDENGQNGYAADFASGGGKYIASTMQYGMPFTQTGYYNILSLDIDFTQDWWDQNYIHVHSMALRAKSPIME